MATHSEEASLSVVEEEDSFSISFYKSSEVYIGCATILKSVNDLELSFPEYKFPNTSNSMTLEKFFISNQFQSDGYGTFFLKKIFKWSRNKKIDLYWNAYPIKVVDSHDFDSDSDSDSSCSSYSDNGSASDFDPEDEDQDELSFNEDSESPDFQSQSLEDRLRRFYKKNGGAVLVESINGTLMIRSFHKVAPY